VKTPRVKLVPPRLPTSHVARPALERLLDEAERRRLTSIVAGPGFGKSTLAASVATERGWHWYLVDGGDRSLTSFARGLADALELEIGEDAFSGSEDGSRVEALAAVLTQALEDETASDQVLVLDDVHELGDGGAAARLLEGLVRQAPPELHLVLASRDAPPFPIDRLRGQGQVLDVDAAMLTFTGDEVAGVVGDGLRDPIHELTAGWPAAVQLTAEMLHTVPQEERARTLAELGGSGDRLGSYLAREVLERETDEVRELLRIAAEFDRFSAELCEAVGAAQPADFLLGLQRRGLIAARSGPGGWLTLHAVLRDFLREHLPLSEAELVELHVKAAEWFFAQGLLREGLASLKTARRPELIAAALRDHWREWYDQGLVGAVVDAAEVLPESYVDEGLRHLIGRSHVLVGRSGEALEWFAALPPGPDRAFEFADVYTGRGELSKAFDVLVEALERYPDPPHAYCCIFIAFLASGLGELEAGAKAAQLSLELGKESGDLGHLADAHAGVADIAQARGEVGEAERHYQAARELAERGGNLLALCAAQVKTARFWTVQGRYQEAWSLVEAATELADRIGFVLMRSEGRHLRASLHARAGRFDEGAAELAEAVALDRLAGMSTVWDFVAHGDLYSERGDVARARIAYQEALDRADPRGVRMRSIALGGLARAVAGDDPDRASTLASEAVELSVNERPELLLIAGWIALRRGELERAAALADEAAEDSRRRGARPLTAASLELRAFCGGAPDTVLLEEALALRRDLGEPVAAAQVELALARLSGTRLEAERAERELRKLGFRDTEGRAAGVLMAAGTDGPSTLAVQTLGGFRLLRYGEPVPPEAWKSKKARDLLKMLVARRGAPVARDQVIEALWPDEDPGRTGNRLSVALSTLRSVLDPDRTLAQDHYVVAADGALRLAVEDIELDVEWFLRTAEAGLRAPASDALQLLELAEAAYTGDFLEEDRYEDWAEPLRNEARTLYLDVLRALAETTGSAKYLLRIIERDPYDEQAHLGLVAALQAAGSHGEARRAYRTYVSRMQEIGAEPAQFALSPV
jgi:DNA-binding SARP family transcriptional activator/tetratricopeptide (TPR) repeat protein